jgi:hypothetical protein
MAETLGIIDVLGATKGATWVQRGRNISTGLLDFSFQHWLNNDENDSLSSKTVLMSADEKRPACPLPESALDQAASSRSLEGEYWRWCPRCGHELHNEKCKLRCPRCHYFLSCSDFD